MEGSAGKRKPIAFPLPEPSSKRCERDDEVARPRFADSSDSIRSSDPARFVFYEKGEWRHFFEETSLALVTAFRAGHRCVKFTFHGSRYLLSFIRKLQVNLDTGFCRSVGWIDVHGKRSVPARCFEGYGARLPFSRGPPSRALQVISDFRGLRRAETSLHLDIGEDRMAYTNTESSAPSAEDASDNEVSSNASDTSSTVTSLDSTSEATSGLQTHAVSPDNPQQYPPFPLLDGKLTSLKASDPEFEEVKKRFVAGLSVLANHATISNITKTCHRTTSGHLRHEAFKQQEGLTKRLRGDANTRYAWYGTSKHGVSSIVLHGFGQPKSPIDGAMYGVGIYLAPERYSHAGAVHSDVDENGVQHVLLCRIIMGNMEQVARGSEQFHPSTEDYDNGVDDLCNPRQYVVWSTHMNTHILPEYVVSFKLAAPWQGVVAALRGRLRCGHESSQPKLHAKVGRRKNVPPRSSWMSIDMLFLLLKSSLSMEKMSVLQQHHSDLKGGRLSSSDFINYVRNIVGDSLVSSTLRSMKTHVLGAFVLQNLLASGKYKIVANGG